MRERSDGFTQFGLYLRALGFILTVNHCVLLTHSSVVCVIGRKSCYPGLKSVQMSW